MTAINVIRQREAVHIITDGAVCNSEGVICEIGPNAFALPNIPAALAIRGATQFMPFLVHRLSRECQSFDELLKKVVPVALEVHMSVPMTLAYGEVRPNFDLVLAGWSYERGRPESFIMTSKEGPDRLGLMDAWRLISLPDVLIAPTLSMAQIQSVGWRAPENVEAFKPNIDGIKLLTAQRLSTSLRVPIRTCNLDSVVGGFVQLTTVHSQGVASTILHRWPDRMGQRIE